MRKVGEKWNLHLFPVCWGRNAMISHSGIHTSFLFVLSSHHFLLQICQIRQDESLKEIHRNLFHASDVAPVQCATLSASASPEEHTHLFHSSLSLFLLFEFLVSCSPLQLVNLSALSSLCLSSFAAKKKCTEKTMPNSSSHKFQLSIYWNPTTTTSTDDLPMPVCIRNTWSKFAVTMFYRSIWLLTISLQWKWMPLF